MKVLHTLRNVKNNYIVYSRLKTPDRVFNKIVKKGYINDLLGVRVVYNGLPDDAAIIANELEKDFDVIYTRDYINNPKDNGYQSLHLICTFHGIPVEIQIRTHEMDHHANFGDSRVNTSISYHNSYK